MMKKNRNKIAVMLLAVGLSFVFASCEDDRNSNPTLQTPTKFVLNTPAYAEGAVYDLENSSSVELTCSQPDYGFTAATVYSVQVSLDNDFTTEGKYATLATTYTTAKMAVDATEIAVAQTTLALEKGIAEDRFPLTSKLYVRLRAALTNGKGEIFSNTVTLHTRTKFALSPIVLPQTMNIVGSTIGNWKWEDGMEMVPTWAKNGTFWRILYFEKDAKMKFNIEKGWDGREFGGSATLEDHAGAGLSDAGGNLRVAKAGWYLVVIRTAIEGRNLKYTVAFEKPNVYVVGHTMNGNWDTTDEKRFTVPADAKGDFVSPAFLSTGEVRMCVKLDDADWWHSEFIVYADGKIAYRGSGDDQERYTQPAGKRAYLNFMTGKGRYE